ncbi:Gfo/Idh/MocA family oxidoreductase [Devosia rhodophyticola]|uniref:Gfo/Idh/MocA family oxidoreductase n=1 Tax=Devosia rhodophyticola TaxID=3026423 RepID=A0ABY7YYT7_9HYPH|nr:Gfo/Idh/MocA family oxidoreductase [Devosia rhodophyticola]WDR06238.1 Gfo/Idh/MocA family oxidoreductase [Devosia rhodophyticola]
MIGIGVIGYGYWGPNLVRNFCDIPGVQVHWVCDLRTERLAGIRLRYPAVGITEDVDEVLRDPRIDAVAIATPVSSHFEIAMRALRAGKNVFVEKPITATAEQAERLNEEADRRGLIVAVDHTFIHTGAVKKLRELIKNDLGDVYYYDSVRVNLGIFQRDVSVMWDLAVHDLAIMDFVLDARPRAVSAVGMSHVAGVPENIAYLNLHFDCKLMAHVHVNWLAPVKIRRTLIGGSNKMIVYDDLEPSEKIKVYDRGITVDPMAPRASERIRQMRIGYRAGDMFAPQLDVTEALGCELREFVSCVEHGTRPTADGIAGLRVVRILEAASKSMANGGQMVELPQEMVLA